MPGFSEGFGPPAVSGCSPSSLAWLLGPLALWARDKDRQRERERERVVEATWVNVPRTSVREHQNHQQGLVNLLEQKQESGREDSGCRKKAFSGEEEEGRRRGTTKGERKGRSSVSDTHVQSRFIWTSKAETGGGIGPAPGRGGLFHPDLLAMFPFFFFFFFFTLYSIYPR